jgi:hypothetical protein
METTAGGAMIGPRDRPDLDARVYDHSKPYRQKSEEESASSTPVPGGDRGPEDETPLARLRNVGKELNRGALIANLAEVLWDIADDQSKLNLALQAERDSLKVELDQMTRVNDYAQNAFNVALRGKEQAEAALLASQQAQATLQGQIRTLLEGWRESANNLYSEADWLDGCNGRPLDPEKRRQLTIQADERWACTDQVLALLAPAPTE